MIYLRNTSIMSIAQNVIGAKGAKDLGPIYTKRQRQRCDDACDSVLIENNSVAPEWVCNPFSSISIDFNENRIASVIAEWSKRWRWRLV